MTRLLKSFAFAYNGLIYALKTQRNFRIHWLCATMVFLLNILINFILWQKVVFFLLTFLVLSAELFNCALEHICDLSGTGYSLQKKHIKDLSAASVLMISAGAFAIFLLILLTNLEVILLSLRLESILWFLSFTIFALNLPWPKFARFASAVSLLILAGIIIYMLAAPLFSLLALLFLGLLMATNPVRS